MSILRWEARKHEISEEIRRLAAREAELVAEWHRLEYAMVEAQRMSSGPFDLEIEFDLDSDHSPSSQDTVIETLPCNEQMTARSART